MKKHTIELIYNKIDYYWNKKSCIYICIEVISDILDFPKEKPKTIWVTFSSKKFKNSLKVTLLPNPDLDFKFLHGCIIDNRIYSTTAGFDQYMIGKLGKITEETTIYAMLEYEV